MTAPSPWLRPLQALAILLALAIVTLLVAWIRMEPPSATSAAAAPDPHESAVAPPALRTPAAQDASPPPPNQPAAATPTPSATVAPDVSAVLYGTVKSARGEPITRGFLWLMRDDRQVGMASLQKGPFAFAGLHSGLYRLTSRIDDQLPLDREVRVDAPATRLDLQLDACHVLTVNAVTPDGAPLIEAMQDAMGISRSLRALAFAAPLTGDLPPTDRAELEGGLGPFRGRDFFPRGDTKAMPKQTVGVLTLPPNRAVHVALLLGSTLLTEQSATAEQEELTFVIAPDVVLGKRCGLRVRFVDAAGAPVADAPVTLSSAAGTQMGGGTMRTDADGRYQTTGLVPGWIGVGVFHQELRSPALRVAIAAGADLDLGDVVVRKGVPVEFALDNFGERGGIWLMSSEPPPRAGARARELYIARENGSLQKQLLYPGRYTAVANSSNGTAILAFDTAASPPQPIRLAVRPGAVLRLAPAADSFARFTIESIRGAPLRTGELGNRVSTLTLPLGDYRMTITDRTGEVTQRTFTLPAGGTTLTVP